MPRVSVIIPVYNARDYIIPCVESLTNQSLEDIELLFVDDHGTDDSMAAVRHFAEGYSGKKQFRFLETSVNSGPGVARNVGIEAAEGEYVAFVDSDDWVERDFCETLYKAATRKNADLAWCDLRQDNLRDGSSRDLLNPRISSGDFNEKKHKAFLTQFVSYFTTYLYRREFLIQNALRFPDTRSSEDSSFLACCLLVARRIACVEKPLYHYVLRSRSLSTKVDPTKYLQKMGSFDTFLGFARRQDLYENYKEEIDFLYIKKAFLMAAQTYVANELKPDPKVLQDELFAALLKNVPDYASNRYLKKNLKARTMTKWIARHPRLALWALKRRARENALEA